jgi:hypothetical protein
MFGRAPGGMKPKLDRLEHGVIGFGRIPDDDHPIRTCFSASIARRKFNSDLSCQRTSHVGPFEWSGLGFVEILNKG